MNTCIRIGLAAVMLVVSAAGAAAGPLQDDLRARRSRVMERLGPESLLIVWGEPNAENLYYLTGTTQEDSILVLMPGNRTRKAILFVRGFNARREHREGHSLTPAEATELTGIESVYELDQFEPFIEAMFSVHPFESDDDAARGLSSSAEYQSFFMALENNRARLALVLGRRSLSGPPGKPLEFANLLRERFDGFTLRDATEVIHGLRQIKTAYEQGIMRRSLEISNEAHMAGMRAAAPGRHEYEVESAIEAVYLKNGAMRPGYDSIVGSGPNGTILHYNESSRKMEPGDLLLVDAAGSYQGYTGDITRTYPVSGTFTPAQREIYEIVLAAQEAGIKAAKPGARVSDIRAACADVVRKGLVRLGLIADATGDQYRVWYTHGPVHWLGLNVHDVGTTDVLAPGMAFVIEPGIYIRQQALDTLPATKANLAFIEKVQPVVTKYLHTGVRIEDSFLMTATGPERLSAPVPRTIEEIESYLRRSSGSARESAAALRAAERKNTVSIPAAPMSPPTSNR
jgi:Xaa-Pro aminopeptidase